MNESSSELFRLLGLEVVADVLDVSPKTVRREIAAGELVAVRVGAQLKVTPDDLRDYIRRRRTVRTHRDTRTKPRLSKTS